MCGADIRQNPPVDSSKDEKKINDIFIIGNVYRSKTNKNIRISTTKSKSM